MTFPRIDMNDDGPYDDFVAKVDAGQACPVCQSQRITIENHRAPVLYRCGWCKTGFYDWVTRETAGGHTA